MTSLRFVTSVHLFIVVVIIGNNESYVEGGRRRRKRSNNKRKLSNKLYNDENPCRLWLAPSYLSNKLSRDDVSEDESNGASKFALGLYAGIDFQKNDIIPPGPELGIPLNDFMELVNTRNKIHKKTASFLESHLWNAEYGGSSARWAGNYSVLIAAPGIGSLANYHSGISNVDWDRASTLHIHGDNNSEQGRITRTGEPHITRGSITDYDNLTMIATQSIKAGMELFANFGDSWDNITDVDLYQDSLTRHDYADADIFLDYVLEFFNDTNADADSHEDNDDEEGEEDKRDALLETDTELRQEILDFMLDTVLGTAAGKHAKVIKSLIPANTNKLQEVKDMGGTFHYRNSDIVKSQKWLHTYGICMDNLSVGKSTNAEAGRGAFATRKIKEKSIILASPLLHLPDAIHMFTMYEIKEVYENDDDDEDESDDKERDNNNMPGNKMKMSTKMNTKKKKKKKRNDEDEEPELQYDFDKPIGHQLLVNYCFGHPESSMLLYPVGSMINYINHAPDSRRLKKNEENELQFEANAYITWSEFNDHNLHDRSIKSLSNRDHSSLVINIKALRDLEPGEEIFIDYGKEWEAGYANYKKKYLSTHLKVKMWPFLAEDMITQYKNIPYAVDIQRHKNPYPPGVATVCYLQTIEVDDGQPRVDMDYLANDGDDNPGIDILQFAGPGTINEYSSSDLCVCDLVHREKVDTTEALTLDQHHPPYNYTVYAKLQDGTIEKIINVPHRVITFIDLPYHSDMFSMGKNAFRYYIGFPDNDFPQSWRNLRKAPPSPPPPPSSQKQENQNYDSKI